MHQSLVDSVKFSRNTVASLALAASVALGVGATLRADTVSDVQTDPVAAGASGSPGDPGTPGGTGATGLAADADNTDDDNGSNANFAEAQAGTGGDGGQGGNGQIVIGPSADGGKGGTGGTGGIAEATAGNTNATHSTVISNAQATGGLGGVGGAGGLGTGPGGANGANGDGGAGGNGAADASASKSDGSAVASADANGGDGRNGIGAGNGGSGGDANAESTASADGTDNFAQSVADATGGSGGSSGTGSAGGGGDGVADASASTTGSSSASSNASAQGGSHGGNGNSGNALATAVSTIDGGSATADAGASSQGGIITDMDAFASTAFSGSGSITSQGRTTVGGANPNRSLADGLQGAAYATGLPSFADTNPLLATNPNVDAQIDAADVIGLALQTGTHSTDITGTETASSLSIFSLDTSSLTAPELLIGLLDPELEGTSFDFVHFLVILDGNVAVDLNTMQDVDHTFLDFASAQAFFDDNVLNLGPVGSTVDLQFFLEVSSSSASDGFSTNFLFAVNQAPEPSSFFVVGLGSLAMLRRRARRA